MKRIKLTNNLFLDEYIPKEIYEANIHRPVILHRLINPKLIVADQKLRDEFGPITINNWWNGGNRNASGVRRPSCSGKYWSELSDHSTGNASDKIFRDATAEEVREFIKLNHLKLGITSIEDKVSWVHSSVGWTGVNYLYIFKP